MIKVRLFLLETEAIKIHPDLILQFLDNQINGDTSKIQPSTRAEITRLIHIVEGYLTLGTDKSLKCEHSTIIYKANQDITILQKFTQ